MSEPTYPVSITVVPATSERNRLTAAFRVFLGIPHILLVGAPLATGAWLGWHNHDGVSWGSGSGILGVVAALASCIAWFAIILTGSHPGCLRRVASFYLRWRVRATAYLVLLRDEYPPFGDGDYGAALVLPEAPPQRNRLTVFFRLLMALPHLLVLGLLSFAWAFTTAIAWIMILLTGRFPETLYGFAIGMLAWTTRVEAYLLLLRDEYPPFTLRA